MNKVWKSLIILVLLGGIQTANAEWVKQNTNTFAWFKDVFFLNEIKGWIVGSDGVIISTEDGGKTWVQVKKFTNDALIQIHFTDDMNGWLLCEGNVYDRGSNAVSYVRRTTDGGVTWKKIEFHAGSRERVARILFHRNGDTTAFGEGGVFYKLQRDGVSWKRSRTALHYLLLDGAYSDDGVGAIVGTGGTILFTEDAGLSWERATLFGDLDTRFNAVFFAGQTGAWAVGSRGRIFRSNGGRLWRQQQSGVTANLNDVYFNTAMSGWAVGDLGAIIRTRDGGKTWFGVSSRTTHRLERIVFAGDRGWAVGFGGTILTYDNVLSHDDRGIKPVLMKRM